MRPLHIKKSLSVIIRKNLRHLNILTLIKIKKKKINLRKKRMKRKIKKLKKRRLKKFKLINKKIN